MKKILMATACAALTLVMSACGCSASTDMESSMSTAPSSSSSGSVLSSSDNAGGETKIGLGVVADAGDSQGAEAGYDGRASLNLTVCALSLDGSDRILDVRFDALEHETGFDAAGALTGDMGADISTKRELGDSYGLGNASGIGKEWYEQMDALEDWMRGKTIDEVMDMKLTSDGDRQIPDEEDLRTSVTISVSDQLEALEKAYADATGSASGGSDGSGSSSGGSSGNMSGSASGSTGSSGSSGSQSSSEGSLSDEVDGSSAAQ